MFLPLIEMYNIFISHSWSYSKEYVRLEEMLRSAPRFEFKDYSVPRDDPIHNAGSNLVIAQSHQRSNEACQCCFDTCWGLCDV